MLRFGHSLFTHHFRHSAPVVTVPKGEGIEHFGLGHYPQVNAPWPLRSRNHSDAEFPSAGDAVAEVIRRVYAVMHEESLVSIDENIIPVISPAIHCVVVIDTLALLVRPVLDQSGSLATPVEPDRVRHHTVSGLATFAPIGAFAVNDKNVIVSGKKLSTKSSLTRSRSADKHSAFIREWPHFLQGKWH